MKVVCVKYQLISPSDVYEVLKMETNMRLQELKRLVFP